MRSWGFETEEAAAPGVALQLLRAAAAEGKRFRAALLDFQMPEMDGIELGTRIRADESLRGICLLLLTSVSRLGVSTRAVECGFDGYLTKPIKPSYLYDTLISALCGEKEIRMVAAGLEAKTSPPSLVRRARENPARILVAEDNIVNRRVSMKMIERMGHRVDAVANGREALEAIDLSPYDLVLMDCQMPEMDGYEATRLLRARETDGKHVIVVAMTANALRGDREECLSAGMDDYLAKPVRAEELEKLLDQWLERARAT